MGTLFADTFYGSSHLSIAGGMNNALITAEKLGKNCVNRSLFAHDFREAL